MGEKEEKGEGKKERGGKAWKLYEVDYGKKTVKLKNRKCPRCAKIMAFHESPKPRWACGGCNYTEYVKKSP